jgi:sodium transport system permease protein
MNPLLSVLRKEVRENLRDRRAMSSALLYGPLLGPVLFAAIVTFIIGQQQARAEQPLQLPVVGAEHAPQLVQALKQRGIEIQAPPADPEAAIRTQEQDVILRIPADYPRQWRSGTPARVDLLFDASRQNAQIAVARSREALAQYAGESGAQRLMLRGISPSVASPVAIADQDLSTPQSRAALMMAMLPYFLVLSAFVGGMYLAIDTTSGERERGSLEPLLLTPASRGQILWGKMAATALFAGASLLICVAAFAVSMRFIPTAGLGFSLKLPLVTVLQMALVVLPLALLAAAAQTIVASFAQSFREAQTYLQFLVLIPAIPSILLAINPVKPDPWMSWVPLFSQTVQINLLARGEPPGAAALALAALLTLLAAWLLGRLAVKLFSRESAALGG